MSRRSLLFVVTRPKFAFVGSAYALDGGTAIQRLTLEGGNRAPIWTPDAAWITFQSDREGDHGLFARIRSFQLFRERQWSNGGLKGGTVIGQFALDHVHVGRADLASHIKIARRFVELVGRSDLHHGAVAQATFLETLGIRTRAALLSAGASENDRRSIAEGMARLIDPRQMGSLFKALAICHPDLQELAGFP